MLIRVMTILTLATMLFACKGKKDMSGSDEVSIGDFIDFFEDVKLPITLDEKSLQEKTNDSATIGRAVFNQFIGDSIFTPIFGKEAPNIYAMGKFRNGEEETYLLLRAKHGKTTAMYVVAITPEEVYSAHLQLLTNKAKANQINKVVIDARYTFTMVDNYKEADGSTSEFSAVYAYNNAGLFMVIMKNGLKKGEKMAIINPIDSLPALQKYAGDYGKDERNFITVRDGKTAQDFIFFINFDRGGGSECHAELKGEARFVTQDSAVYISPTDPCTIGFKFGRSGIRITEATNCGTKRPQDCSFNAYYQKEKAVTNKQKTSK